MWYWNKANFEGLRDIAAEGVDAVPFRWLGIHRRSRPLLERALQLDSRDEIARVALIDLLLDAVAHATHHLSEDSFIGDEKEASHALGAATAELASLPESERKRHLETGLAAQHSLLADWVEFKALGLRTGFRTWCEQRGHVHPWSTAYYYRRR